MRVFLHKRTRVGLYCYIHFRNGIYSLSTAAWPIDLVSEQHFIPNRRTLRRSSSEKNKKDSARLRPKEPGSQKTKLSRGELHVIQPGTIGSDTWGHG